MRVTVPLNAGYLPDEFGKYAPDKFLIQGYPSQSFPIHISDAPDGTASFALSIIDWDSIPVAGFAWIHWVAINIPGDTTDIPANASRNGFPMIQGTNSNGGSLIGLTDSEITQHYVGPQPPNMDHNYTLLVSALDTTLDLAPGFWLNEARAAMAGHVLSQASLSLLSRV